MLIIVIKTVRNFPCLRAIYRNRIMWFFIYFFLLLFIRYSTYARAACVCVCFHVGSVLAIFPKIKKKQNKKNIKSNSYTYVRTAHTLQPFRIVIARACSLAAVAIYSETRSSVSRRCIRNRYKTTIG